MDCVLLINLFDKPEEYSELVVPNTDWHLFKKKQTRVMQKHLLEENYTFEENFDI